jgi:hypothetical protein
MSTKTFTATVQYGDMKGESKADRADLNNADNWLKEHGHINDDGEILVGIELSVGENHNKHEDPVAVYFYMASSGEFNTVKDMIDSKKDSVKVRRIAIDMPIFDFLGLFKRFSITLSEDGILEGCTIKYDD